MVMSHLLAKAAITLSVVAVFASCKGDGKKGLLLVNVSTVVSFWVDWLLLPQAPSSKIAAASGTIDNLEIVFMQMEF